MAKLRSFFGAALVALTPVLGAELKLPASGEMSIVFPRNETYAVVSPFPIVFGYRNAPAILSYDSQLRWNVDCVNHTLYGSSTVNGYDNAVIPSEPYFVLNSTKTLYESSPDYLKNKDGPFGSFRGNSDRCTLTWTFFYWTVCRKLPNGGTLIQSGVGRKQGNVTFTIQPGATLPHDAIAKYEGCPVGGLAETIKSESSTFCPDTDKSPDLAPCELDVKPAASSIASAVMPATTTFTGRPTSTSAPASTSTSGSGSSGSSGDKKSDAAGLSVNAGIGLVLGMLMV